MSKRDTQHYRNMMNKNPSAWVGFALAAHAIQAAIQGASEFTNPDPEWERIARSLKSRFGETLTPRQVLMEMDRAEQAGDYDET